MLPTNQIDFTRVRARTYAVQFRFVVDCPSTFKSKAHYYRHYMSRWSVFISQVMRNRLSKTQVRDILPEIREILPIRITLSDLYPLLFEVNPSLARSCLDCSVVFDESPNELKSHIITSFNITPDQLQEYLDRKDEGAKSVA